MLDVHALSALHQRDRDVGRGLEVEMPEGATVFRFIIDRASGQRAFAPYYAGDGVGVLRTICMRDHSSNIMAY